MAVVKNIPEMNALLWRVKHLIRIDPVTFPDGEPSKDDLDGWQLLEVSAEVLLPCWMCYKAVHCWSCIFEN